MRVHLVDGTFELFRAYFGHRPDHKDAQGRSVKATLGVVQSLFALLSDATEQVTHIAVAFDNPIRSFRNDLFFGYKTEAGVPEDLLAQFDLIEVAVRAMGIVVWSMNEFEADDALAAGAAKFRDAPGVEQVRIMTPDKDLGQCLRDERVVQIDRMRKKLITASTLLETRGVHPESIPDWLALVGDTSDGIPGIAGFGEKGAATVLREYRHLENIPERASDWRVVVRGAESLAARLSAERENALLYRKLATLVETVPLREELGDLEWRGAPKDAYEAWCDSVLGSKDLRARPSKFV